MIDIVLYYVARYSDLFMPAKACMGTWTWKSALVVVELPWYALCDRTIE